MKSLKITFVLLLTASISCAQLSPRQQDSGKIGEVTIDLDYSAPSVRERTIYGALVPYNTVWRAGANANTTFSFDKDVKIGDNAVPAGKYGVYMIPKQDDKWIIILSTVNDARGSGDYTKDQDQMRIEIKPKMVEKSQEQLKYKVVEKGIKFAWEKARIIIPVQ